MNKLEHRDPARCICHGRGTWRMALPTEGPVFLEDDKARPFLDFDVVPTPAIERKCSYHHWENQRGDNPSS